MYGITIIIILLVPIAFQIVYQSIKQEKRHQEIKDILHRIEKKLK